MPINERESAHGPDVVGYTWLVQGFQRGDFYMADPGDPELHLEGTVPVLADDLRDICRSAELRTHAAEEARAAGDFAASPDIRHLRHRYVVSSRDYATALSVCLPLPPIFGISARCPTPTW